MPSDLQEIVEYYCFECEAIFIESEDECCPECGSEDIEIVEDSEEEWED